MCSAGELKRVREEVLNAHNTRKVETYQASIYVAAISAVQRHLPTLEHPFNLRSDEAFNSSNQMLDAVLKVYKANGHRHRLYSNP